MNIIQGYENGRYKYLQLHPAEAFTVWTDHYSEHLKRLYKIFQDACHENTVNWYSIDFETFKKYVYTNSTKYLSPWI